jgi:arginyl-tRNA synthetase
MMGKESLEEALCNAVAEAKRSGALPDDLAVDVDLQRPRDPRHGDFSTSLALVIGSKLSRPPREVAEVLMQCLQLPEGVAEGIDIAGPGFINFSLSPSWLRGVVQRIADEGESYGRSDVGKGRKLLLEFVSANPTGPLAVVNGRAAAIGDALAKLLEYSGWDVSREYYVNDATNSTQVQRFAETLDARYRQELGKDAVVPEDGYQGDYVIDLARQIADAEGDRYLRLTTEDRIAAFSERSLKEIVASQQRDMGAFGVEFDTWFMESSLYERGEVNAAIESLGEHGYTYEADGALWLKATDLGDEQDQVLVRTDGRPSYLAADIAYHRNKFERGFDRLIDIWGPDHHGHVRRTKAGVEALGYERERFEILIHQFVRLFRGSELIRMSKRAGDIVLLADLLEDVGSDAARFFFLAQSMDSHLDFDLELAKKQASENPVYYVQYAHARICSILREAEERSVSFSARGEADLDRLEAPDELSLMRKLADLPEEIREAAARYEPHRMTRYARELAAAFHSFYTNCRVLSDDAGLTAARLALVDATRSVLCATLRIIGVSAPDRM